MYFGLVSKDTPNAFNSNLRATVNENLLRREKKSSPRLHLCIRCHVYQLIYEELVANLCTVFL